jgi:hypothetical protein
MTLRPFSDIIKELQRENAALRADMESLRELHRIEMQCLRESLAIPTALGIPVAPEALEHLSLAPGDEQSTSHKGPNHG